MTFKIVQNDTAPPISSRLADAGSPVDLTNVSNVKLHVEDEFQRVIISADLTGRVNIVEPTLGEVEYVWRPGDTEDTGLYRAEWQVLYEDGNIETFPSSEKITIEIVEEIE